MYKVLLVDDEYLPKMALRKMADWESCGCVLAGTASNGAEALEWHRRNKADIIITDLKMPVMDGIELVRALAGESFDGAVLVLSNYADFELVREALVAGALNYMLKINLNAEEVERQLRQTAEHIARRRQTSLADRDRSSMALKYGARVRAEALQDYFLYAGTPVPPVLREEYADTEHWLCVISARGCDMQEKNRQKVYGHMADLLREAFEEASPFNCFTDRESVVFTVPCVPLRAKGRRIESRLEHAKRQIETYLSLPHTAVALSVPVRTLPLLKEQFESCSLALSLSFYTNCPALIYSDKVSVKPLRSHAEIEDAAGEAARLFLVGRQAQAGDLADRLLDRYCEEAVCPDEVCRAWRDAAYQLAVSAGAALNADELENMLSALRYADTQAALKKAFLGMLPALAEQGQNKSVKKQRTSAQDVLMYVQQHYAEKITLEDISAAFFLEKSYLCRWFKKETGISLFRHINNLRMQRAAVLIAEGAVYVKEAAAAVGLPDSFYFTRLFTKYHGVSPSAYRSAAAEARARDAAHPAQATGGEETPP